MNEKKNDDNRGQTIDDTVLGRIAAANEYWTESSRQQMMKMVDEITRRNNHIQNIIGTDQSIPIKGGFVAEDIHTETHNLQMTLENKSARAITDRDPEWTSYNLKPNDPETDIAIIDGGKVIHKAQVKYCQDSQNTANAMREMRDGIPHYKEADSFIGPSDQVNPNDGSPSIGDVARRTRLKNQETRPDVAEAAKRVEDRGTDKLVGKSRPTSKHEAHEVAKKGSREGQDLRKDYQNGYMTKSTIQQMQRAAASAAGIAAIMAGTLNTIQYLRLVTEGKITTSDAVFGIVKNTAVTAADSALKAGAAAGAVSVATRVSAQTIAGQAVNAIGTSGVAGAAICTVDLIECMVMVAAGKMTLTEMETRTGKNILQTAAGVWGSSVGMSVAGSLSITAGLGVFMAAMAGGMIAGIAMSIAIENHVEKPYKEIMENTAMLTETAKVLRGTTEAFAIGQKAFAGFLIEDRQLDRLIDNQLSLIEIAGDKMKKSIDRL